METQLQAEDSHREVQVQHPKHQVQPQLNTSPPYAAAESSPSHEFSFTISLHHSKSKSSPPTPSSNPLTVDLSPADEIFFRGHLLPLHLLSHLPAVSPRASTHSASGFSLPSEDHDVNNSSTKTVDQTSHELITKEGRKSKSKSFSLFQIPSKWRKESKSNLYGDDSGADHRPKSRKSKFDAMKRFLRSIKLKPAFFTFMRRNHDEFQRQQYYSSYSGNLSLRSKKEATGRRRRGEYSYSSAPTTMGNSPTNSGVLVASGTVSPTKSDSTMEELQAAIQAAIAHCKNSIAATEDKIKVP